MPSRKLKNALAAAGAIAAVTTVATLGPGANAETTAPTALSGAVTPKPGTGLDLTKIPAPAKQRFSTVGNPVGIHGQSITSKRVAPSSYSLESHAPTPKDQGQNNSCVTWAVAYGGYGVSMNSQGISGGPMAPMYLYSQISGGRDQGTFGAHVLDMAVDQGVAPRSVYWQGDFDFRTMPTQEQREAASHYKLSGYQTIPVYGSQAKSRIQQAVSAGMPVAIGMLIYDDLYRISWSTARDGSYQPSGNQAGGHEMLIIGYDEKGVRIQNSWGSSWGDGGRFWLSWDYLLNSGDLKEANAIGAVKYTG